MKKTVVSIVLNNFKNDSRVLKENISLYNAGYNTIVVALHEEFLSESENIQNIQVHRIKLRQYKYSKNIIVKILKHIEFAKKSIKFFKDYDIFHCNDINTLHIGVIIKIYYNKNAKVVYDAHEYETETKGQNGIRKIFTRQLEKILIKYADKVLCVSNSIANEYVRLYNIEKPVLILNTPPYFKIEKKDYFRENLKIGKDKNIFLYQGALAKARGIEILLETFKDLEDKMAVVVFMGYGELEDMIKQHSKKYNNIFFHNAVSPDILLDYTGSADFGISTIEDTCLSYRYSLPNKMFEYLMAEIPTIVSNLPEMKKVVLDNNIGIVAKENSVEGLKKAINKATNFDKNKFKRNIQKVKKIYNWEKQEQTLLEVYSKLY
jgi:glycosyltransferase involved in cell wall biosynthesis